MHLQHAQRATRQPAVAVASHIQRARLEAALDRLLEAAHGLIAQLDAIDGDPDLEPEMVEDQGDLEPDEGR